jgi:ribosomal protein S14
MVSKFLYRKEQLRYKKVYRKEKHINLLYKFLIDLNNSKLESDYKKKQTFLIWSLIHKINFKNVLRPTTRCVVSNSSKSVYKKFKLSRMTLKKYISKGYIVGINKNSW